MGNREHINLRQMECTGLLHNMKQNHEKQLVDLRAGMREIRLLLEEDGFHAEQTSEHVRLLLECMEKEIEPQMVALLQESEAILETMMQQTQREDHVV